MRCRFIFLIFTLFIGFTVSAQHLQLINDRGEAGVFLGYSSYSGDIASDVQFIKMNYGAFYKKQLNEYIGLRLNYEKMNIGASDANSQNAYDLSRGFVFERDFHEISVLSELYFNRFITDRKEYRFSPYLGFGAGSIFSGNMDRNNFSKKTKTDYTILITNIGFKWNLYKQINLFGEFKYRFTTSDYIDHFTDATPMKLLTAASSAPTYQGSKSGKDDLLSASFGLSYNFRKIYGPERFKKKKSNKSAIEDHSQKSASKFPFLFSKKRK